MIQFDAVRGSVVATCVCGARALTNTPTQAEGWASDHLERHARLDAEREERRRAIAAAAARRRRHAD